MPPALDIATEAIDRLHSTAHSHHRIIIAEIMGHRAGWLTLGAGIAGGADVILIPEIPYNVEKIADAIKRRSRHSANFSIVAVAEGAMSVDDARAFAGAEAKRERAKTVHDKKVAKVELAALEARHTGNTIRLGPATGGTHAPRIARDDSWLRPARRHAVADGPVAGHAAGRRVRGSDQTKVFLA